LGQLPIEPCDFLVPKLNGRLRLLERGALTLELALHLLSFHALTHEGGSGLLKGGPLLLELRLRMLADAPLLLELHLHRGKRSDLVCQAGPQLLSLFGLLLNLALPRPCPLEGCTVLLELGTSRSELCLPLFHHSPHRGEVLACLPQRLVSLQKRRCHLLDHGGVFRSLGALGQESILHNSQPLLQPPIVGPRGLHEGVKGVVLVPVPVALGSQLGEVVVPLPSLAL
jgi:hypothetical protein